MIMNNKNSACLLHGSVSLGVFLQLARISTQTLKVLDSTIRQLEENKGIQLERKDLYYLYLQMKYTQKRMIAKTSLKNNNKKQENLTIPSFNICYKVMVIIKNSVILA